MLYELSRGITNRDVYSTAVAEKSGYDEKTTMKCFEYLESKGYVTIARPKPTGVQFDLIRITSKGVEVVEKLTKDAESRGRNHDFKLTQGIKIFISYAKVDLEFALELYKHLKNEDGLNPWIDDDCMLPGQNWKFAISEAVKDSRFFIALLSSNSTNKRGYVQKELKEALDILNLIPRVRLYIIPARLNDCEVEDNRLNEIHYVDLFPDWDKGVNRILSTIHHFSSGSST